MEPKIIEFADKAKIEEEAWQWVIKFESDTSPSAEEVAALNRWLEQSPLHKETLSRVAKGWNNLDLLGELVIPTAPPPRAGSGFMVSVMLWLLSPLVLLASLSGQVFNSIGELFRSRALLVSTTTVTGGGAALWLLMPLLLSTLAVWQAPGEGSFKTGVGEQSSFTLADGSTLWLNTSSHVVLAINDSSRQIRLISGEAHFDVYHDPDRPFEVYANKKMVRAVGTAFSVFIEEQGVEVLVTEGRVQLGVASTQQQSPIQDKPSAILGELSAGQTLVIAGDTPEVMQAVTEYQPAELNRKMAWLNGELIYAGESLDAVIKEVSRYTPITIELVDPELADIRIGGQFQVGQTEALFEVLELGFGLRVSRLSANHVQVHAKQK